MERKRHHEEEHESEERWLLTYADLITLLMVFFIVMYAMSKVDASKAQQLVFSMRMAFKNPPTSAKSQKAFGVQTGSSLTVQQRTPRTTSPPLPTEATNADRTPPRSKEMQGVKQKFDELVKQKGLEKKVSVTVGPGGDSIVVRLADSLLFDAGSADLTEQAKQLLDNIGLILAASGKYVRILGHTDNTPIHNARYQSNWQLSTDRGTNVLMYLVEHHGLQPDLLSAGGYAEFRPLASNDTPEGRALNRRVEFEIFEEPK